MSEPCGVMGVGHGTDTWDPICDLPRGHGGPHNWTGRGALTDGMKLELALAGVRRLQGRIAAALELLEDIPRAQAEMPSGGAGHKTAGIYVGLVEGAIATLKGERE